jgi:hypothetical protein
MTLLEYIKLNDTAKNELILEKGVLLDLYPEKNKCVRFFSLFDFYVEVISDDEEKIILDVIPYERNFRFGLMQKKKKANRDSIIKTLNSYFLL